MGRSYLFTEIDSGRSFACLGESLGGLAINNKIRIQSSNGNGQIRKIDLEKGLHLRTWDFTLGEGFDFHRIPETDVEAGKAFTIVYILTPSAIILKSTTTDKQVYLRDELSIIMVSNNADIIFRILPRMHVKAIDITISGEWMKNQFVDADPGFRSFISRIKDNKYPAAFMGNGQANEFKLASELLANSTTDDKGMLYQKAKTLSLISEFFKRAFHDHPEELIEGNVLHQEKILLVEKFLEQHLEKDLPLLEVIAKEICLSESTLKRHFKLMFGKSVYEYYLERKMEYAKRLLLDKPLTVKEVASRLGYEKTSNFIHMFKRFHNYSPGHLKKM